MAEKINPALDHGAFEDGVKENQKKEVTVESINQPFWSFKREEVFSHLGTSLGGLLEDDARKRISVYGANAIKEKKRLTTARIIFGQLKSPLILVLIFAGVATVFLGEWVEAAVIFAAVVINTMLGFWQEAKAENALEVLKSYIRTRARVKREGNEREIDASELVPGDIIHIAQGDRVPVDARLIFSQNFSVNESALTGESLPVDKNIQELPAGTELSERTCMVFSGTLAVEGFGNAVVTATGSHTEFGKIAALVAEKEKEHTPLQRAISRFIMRAGLVLSALVLALFGFGIYSGKDFFEMFVISVAVAVSAVPEGLPVAVTVILAVGVQRLAKKKGIVRRLLAAETLGSANLILTDKTGTLTQAQMELVGVMPHGDTGQDAEKNILKSALFNIDAIVENPGDSPSAWVTVGKPLEVALIKGALNYGVKFTVNLSGVEIVDRIFFTSEHKFSVSLIHSDGRSRLVFFGAPDVILTFTDTKEEERKKIIADIERRAFSGERVLGVAIKDYASREEKIPSDFGALRLKFLGLLSFRDPLRPHVGEAIRRIGEAGARTIIVTGDHQGTAEAVARELGLVDGKGAVLTGHDLKHLSKEELWARADEVTVYARVTPEDKLMLTRMYQEKGAVVAVTGDGINDAPALEAADIGIAVGSGTDVAKSAADLVILDDNFETIAAAIEEGRKILDNIRKVIVYLLSSSFDELFLIGGALVAGVALPLNALQILFVNFFSDSFPAVALAFEDGIDGFRKKPRELARDLFDSKLRFLIFVIGASTSALLFALYLYLLSLGLPEDLIRTFIFASFASYTLFLAFSIRSLDRSIFSYNPFSNKYLTYGVGFGLFLTALAIYLPGLQEILNTVSLPPLWVLGVLCVGALNIVAVEFGKWIFRRRTA